jgi:hypothetical protein
MSLLVIGFNAFILSQRVWKSTTRILSILIDIAAAALLITVMKTPGIVGITPEILTSLGLNETADVLSRLVNSIPTMVIAIAVIVTIIKVVITSRRLLQAKSGSPYPIIEVSRMKSSGHSASARFCFIPNNPKWFSVVMTSVVCLQVKSD